MLVSGDEALLQSLGRKASAQSRGPCNVSQPLLRKAASHDALVPPSVLHYLAPSHISTHGECHEMPDPHLHVQ